MRINEITDAEAQLGLLRIIIDNASDKLRAGFGK